MMEIGGNALENEPFNESLFQEILNFPLYPGFQMVNRLHHSDLHVIQECNELNREHWDLHQFD
jgi:hypothetical protein